MMILFAMLAVGVLAVAAVAVTGGLDRMQPVVRDHVEPADDPTIDPADPSTLDDVRFTVRIRGYDMGEVDDLLGRIRAEREQALAGRPAAPGAKSGRWPRLAEAEGSAVDDPEPEPESAKDHRTEHLDV